VNPQFRGGLGGPQRSTKSIVKKRFGNSPVNRMVPGDLSPQTILLGNDLQDRCRNIELALIFRDAVF
jgi:hypothetical protein